MFGRQPNPYHLVAANDYARMVAASYGIDEARTKRFIIHKPEGILFHDAVRRYIALFIQRLRRCLPCHIGLPPLLPRQGAQER